MDKKKRDSILLYQATMAGFKSMLNQGLITPEEYAEIDTKYAQKYGLSLSVIYRPEPLIIVGFRGNMCHDGGDNNEENNTNCGV